jgi:signal transduction histidine kinase
MSTKIDSLFEIRMAWIQSASTVLARGEFLRASISDELGKFFELMIESLVTGDPHWMEPYLDGWVEPGMQSTVHDLLVTDDNERLASVIPILHSLRQVTHEVAQESLSDSKALELLTALNPVFSHAAEYLSYLEVQRSVDSVRSHAEQVRLALEQLDRSKSAFISVAAHELKTPLTLIEGYSGMLRELGLQQNDDLFSALDGIELGIKRLKEIIQDLIDVSMIDNNMLQLQYQPVVIRRLIADAYSEIKPAVIGRNQELSIEPFEGIDDSTYVDPSRLHQAIMNILSNAVKFTPDAGTVSISGRMLPGFVEIIISDSGIGISIKSQASIFEKFGLLQDPALHSTGKTKFMGGGPGLGLPIAKGILDAHGGTIWVESSGHDPVNCPGSRFHLMIPLRDDPPGSDINRFVKNSDI